MVPPTREAVLDFLRDLPCRKVGGIGKVTDRYLAALEVTRVGQLLDPETRFALRRAFSPKQFAYFLRIGLGIDADADNTSSGSAKKNKRRRAATGAFGQGAHGEGGESGGTGSSRKSLSCERTFRAINDPAEMAQKVQELGATIASQHAECGLSPARTLTLKLKTAECVVLAASSWLTSHCARLH